VLGLNETSADTTSSLHGNSDKNTTTVDEKPVNDQTGSPGPKKETEPKVPEHGQELKDAPTSPKFPKPDKE
jgi:hypothetical protein